MGRGRVQVTGGESLGTDPHVAGGGPPEDGAGNGIARALSRAWQVLTDNLLPLALVILVGAVVTGFVVTHTGTDARVVLRQHLVETYGAQLEGPQTGHAIRQVTVLKDGYSQVCTLDESKGAEKATLSLCLPAAQ